MNYLVFDLIIAAVLIFYVLQGKKKGFVLTLCGLLAVFVAFIGAAVLSNMMCEPVGRLVQPAIESGITQTLEQLSESQPLNVDEGMTQAALENLPVAQAVAALKDSELYRVFGDTLENGLERGLLEMTTTAAAAISAYLAREVARIVLFVISFVVILLVWYILSHALDLAFRLPVLSSVNAGLGAVMGLIKGMLLIFIAVWVLKNQLAPHSVEETVLLKFFCGTSPLTLVTRPLNLAKMVWSLP